MPLDLLDQLILNFLSLQHSLLIVDQEAANPLRLLPLNLLSPLDLLAVLLSLGPASSESLIQSLDEARYTCDHLLLQLAALERSLVVRPGESIQFLDDFP